MDVVDTTPWGVESTLRNLFRRNCLDCPPEQLLCPTCPSNQVCIQVVQTCQQCPYRKCVPSGQSGATYTAPSSTSSGPNVGAIVGGVVGGLVAIGIAVFCVWYFIIRKRRQQWEQTYEGYAPTEKSGSGASGGYARSVATARSRASIASTAYTRASNVIQIAFIPGVTGRSEDAYTPPVPPIPSSQPGSPFTNNSTDHYFMPGDLRDSTYSGFTDDGASTIGRRSMARSIAPSIAPSLLRQSVASTIYQEDTLQNPMPAQTMVRGRANIVSVQRSGTVTRAPSMPAVPQIDRAKYGGQVAPINPPPSQAAPLVPSSDETTVPLIHVSSDAASDSGFSVQTGRPEVQSAIEEATRRASKQPTHGGLGSVRSREPSPFSDSNRISEASL